MQTVLLTVRGPKRSIDLKLPAEVPVSEMMPAIVELCDPDLVRGQDWDSQVRWSLFLEATGALLDAGKSLKEAGVTDGSLLLLSNLDTITKDQQQRSRPFSPRTIRPDETSGGIGVKWHDQNL